jgi:hypothetical protein
MQKVAIGILAFSVLAIPKLAHANTCDDLHDDAAQKRASKSDDLKALQTVLLSCVSQTECDTATRADCQTWLGEVNAELPTIILDSKEHHPESSEMIPIVVERVTIDQETITGFDELSGRKAIPLNPGDHTFIFTRKGDESVTVHQMVRRGGKSVSVPAVFERKPPPPVSPEPKPAKTVEPPSNVSPDSPPPEKDSGSPLRTVGWALGAAGVIGLGVGIGFGVRAIGAKSDANCDSNNQCDPGKLADARSAATASTAGIIVGGALLAGGIIMFIVSPSNDSKDQAHRFGIAPAVAKNEGGLTLRGAW